MSELPDHDRVRALLKRLDLIQRESEHIRAAIEQIRSSSPEWPPRPRITPPYDEQPDRNGVANG